MAILPFSSSRLAFTEDRLSGPRAIALPLGPAARGDGAWRA
jgi:hypothetical protein